MAPEVVRPRSQLQHLAEQHQHRDDGSGLKIGATDPRPRNAAGKNIGTKRGHQV